MMKVLLEVSAFTFTFIILGFVCKAVLGVVV